MSNLRLYRQYVLLRLRSDIDSGGSLLFGQVHYVSTGFRSLPMVVVQLQLIGSRSIGLVDPRPMILFE